MRRSAWALITVLVGAAAAPGCVGPEIEGEEIEERDSDLSASARRTRSLAIQQVAVEEGFGNAVLLAGIANAETGLAHCWSEAQWACKGPASASCGGGAVIAGAGDGACWRQQGGLGMFQFDAGTHDQTLSRYGRTVLSLEGNVWHGINFVVEMVIRSDYIAGVSTRQEALNWLNSVQVDGRGWDAWLKTVTHYYNGCVPGRCSVYSQRYNGYASRTRELVRELGAGFWARPGAVNPGADDPGADEQAPPRQEPQAVKTPVGLTPQGARIANGGALRLAWAGVPGAATYDLEMTYGRAGALVPYYTWTRFRGASFDVWPQSNDAVYAWRVRACDGAGACSAWSEAATFATGRAVLPEPAPEPDADPDPAEEPDPAPEPDEGLQAPGSVSPAGGTISSPDVELDWSRVEGAVHYDVHFMYSRQGVWTEYHTWTGRRGESFTVWPQVDNTNYRWRVRACDASACSPYSPFEAFFFTGL